jgi:hypothetical protein
MRVIKIDEDSRSERWILWMVAGAAIGVTAGVLAAEKFSGRNPSAKGLLRRARTLVASAREQWGPMLSLALELKDAFGSRSSIGARHDDDELDDEAFDADEDLDDLYEDDELDGGDSIEDPLIGRRVLDAFENDPILAERNVEIDADDEAGTVTLYGSVRAPKEVAHAVTLARGVPGVTKVRQQLEIVRRRR